METKQRVTIDHKRRFISSVSVLDDGWFFGDFDLTLERDGAGRVISAKFERVSE